MTTSAATPPRTLPYVTIKAALRERIAQGGWQPGVRLPSERELVQTFGCARMTVHRALRELEEEGLIERRQGSGSYVAELHPISNLLQVRDIHDEIVERGHVHSTAVFSIAREKASGPAHNTDGKPPSRASDWMMRPCATSANRRRAR